MANISAGSKRLYAHSVMTWAVSLYALCMLWRANQDAVRWVNGGLCLGGRTACPVALLDGHLHSCLRRQ